MEECYCFFVLSILYLFISYFFFFFVCCFFCPSTATCRRTSKETLKSLRSLSLEHLLNVTNFNSLNYGLDGYLLTTRPRDGTNVLLQLLHFCFRHTITDTVPSLLPLSSPSPPPSPFRSYTFSERHHHAGW